MLITELFETLHVYILTTQLLFLFPKPFLDNLNLPSFSGRSVIMHDNIQQKSMLPPQNIPEHKLLIK